MEDIENIIKEIRILINDLPSITDDEKDIKNKILIKLEEIKNKNKILIRLKEIKEIARERLEV